MWFLLSLASAFSYSFRRISEKRLAEKTNHFLLGWALQVFSLPGILAVFLLFATIPKFSSLTDNFWIPLLIIWLILYPVQAYTYYKSLKLGDASYVLPILSLIPVFTVVSSWVLIHEIPSFIGFLGILFIVGGIYSLNIRPGMNSFSPLVYLFREKSSLFMIINCMCLAFGSTLDKIAIQASNPLFYSFVNTVGASSILFLIAKKTNTNFSSSTKKNLKMLVILGFIQALGFTFYIVALSKGIVPYVNAIKSSAAILGSIWGFIFLKEQFNKYKAIALTLVSFGLVFIALG